MSKDRKIITEEKLQSHDYYRIQVQFANRNDKILWAALYNFTAEYYPDIAKRIRDYTSDEVMRKLLRDFRTMLDSNADVKRLHRKWLRENVSGESLLREINAIISRNRL